MVDDRRLQCITRAQVGGHHHNLAERVGRGDRIKRQDKARSRAADIGAPIRCLLAGGEPCIQISHHGIGGLKTGILAQGDVDDQFGPVRGGEELAFDIAHPIDRPRKHRQCHRHGQPFRPHHAAQQPVKDTAHPARFGGMVLHSLGQERITQDRRKQHCHNPRQQQGDHDHIEQRDRVFTRRRGV